MIENPGPGGSLPRLSRDASVGFQVAVEAHLVVNVGVGIGGDISIGDSYFTDVNAELRREPTRMARVAGA